MCWDTIGQQKVGVCETCGVGQQIFSGLRCVRQFTDYLYTDLAQIAEKYKLRIVVFAHNSKG